MLVAQREFRLAGLALGVGDEIPSDLWGRLRERTRRVLQAQRFVGLAKDRTRQSYNQPAPQPVQEPIAAENRCETCGQCFDSPQALGGHRRGHSKRGEHSTPAGSRRAARV